jgi:hypothetical protein
MSSSLDELAVEVLRTNDRGGYTVPTARLYPYQWNWDSAFIALGLATYDRKRAWQEIQFLFEGQWENGMVPSIIFRRNDPDYFPGPETWQCNDCKVLSTGISQPPVAASVARSLVESGDQYDREFAEKLFDAFYGWHKWYHEERKPDNCPIVATVHPWETGRDNCPDWELGLNNMTVDPKLEAYTRMDTVHADANERPSKEQYDKYLTIVKFGRDHNWDQKSLTNEGPFLMADPCIHFILLRADRDLLWLAEQFGKSDYTDEIKGWIDEGVKGSEYLWNPKIKAYCARDVKTGEFSDGFSNASALSFYAGVGSESQMADTISNMQRVQSKVKFMMPSWDPDAANFEPQRYWCGPVWPQMNYMISIGLKEHGFDRMADNIRNDYAALIEQSGFFECFNSVTGEGCIGKQFSWTAALWLAWISPRKNAIAA